MIITIIITTVIKLRPGAVGSAGAAARSIFPISRVLPVKLAQTDLPGARLLRVAPSPAVRSRVGAHGGSLLRDAACEGSGAAVKHFQEKINTRNRRLAELLSFSIHFLLKNAMELFVLLRRKKLKIRL